MGNSRADRRAGPSRPGAPDPFDGTAQIREDISRIIPAYDGIQHLKKKGDNFQWGGPRLCKDYKFNTPDGRARFHIARLPEDSLPEGRFILSTRRGKQFNSIVWGEHDPLTGAGRDEVFISRQDAERLGLEEGRPDPAPFRSPENTGAGSKSPASAPETCRFIGLREMCSSPIGGSIPTAANRTTTPWWRRSP